MKTNKKTVTRIVQALTTREGAGFKVNRPFPTHQLSDFDPFLLLDEMGPDTLGPGEAKGAPDHPHRGFETVTYMLSGEMEHKDSQGNQGKLSPGDVQWMTAGHGVVHSEMPSKAFLASGGKMHGFQLWVNLPSKDKLMKPRYQEIKGAQIPTAELEGTKVKVIAGDIANVSAKIDTRTPIVYFDVQMKPGAEFSYAIPEGFNVFAYLIDGEGEFGEQKSQAKRKDMVLFDTRGEEVFIRATSELRFLLLAGKPLNEPVARYGPFVMNTRKELEQAFLDYQSGKLGSIDF